MRLRPSNFPTIRLSQFASLIHKSSHLFSKILEAELINQLVELFNASASDYWNDHYVFGKKSGGRSKNLGKSGIYLILINTVIPFIFSYGHLKNKADLKDRALRMLENIPGEQNTVIRKWSELGLNIRTAYNTQALLELDKQYCNLKQCLNCAVGNKLISTDG
jgi:hypothetical protein